MTATQRKNTTFMRPQTHTFDFYKDNTGWYIDFPAFIEQGLGTKGDLAMVSGADTMLDYLSDGQPRVMLTFSNMEPAVARFHLRMIHHNQWGATYATSVAEVPFVWLCNVTKVVFGGAHPREIYVQ
ncbi:MAG: hypothetical protein EBS95_09565 [Chitinophagia bacterium]|nr:hypothetical protein [Chitinophagia bacterium]